ncbi:8189_t:CDS:2 [Dentiscutata erythropus]|uniref:8189_t:CDS:1 n=1 Tax=Dentiscutata erythropus TaxID=1348616 RepID=A0A9N9BNP3_9GLOM|nr:8189_t:CDS:2 [Dentiscutata erythropus]
MLNNEERATLMVLIPTLPENKDTLFEYTSFRCNDTEREDAAKCAVITMLLKTGKDIKHLKGLYNYLNNNSTLTSLNIRSIIMDIGRVGTLVEALEKNTTLSSLGIHNHNIFKDGEIKLGDFSRKNTTLTSLSLCGKSSSESAELEERLANTLLINKTLNKLIIQCYDLDTLKELNIKWNDLAEALTNAIAMRTTTLTSLEV